LLAEAIVRDQKAHTAFLKLVEQRKQVMARVKLNALDHLMQGRVEHASERMRAALRDAFALAELPAAADTTDPAPFALRRRSAREALERMEQQIAYLNDWHERLSIDQAIIPPSPKTPKKEVLSLSELLAERVANRHATNRA